MQLDDMRTISALREDTPAPDTVARLSDRTLRAAVLNPDHSEAGRAAATEALRARGLSVDPWSASVPSFLKPRDIVRGDALFFGASARLRQMFGAAAIVSALALLSVLGASVAGRGEIGGEPLRAALAGAAVGSALAWFALFVSRRNVARVTLLRSAHQSGAPLRRFVARELRRYGHVITMAAGAAQDAVRSASHYRTAAARLRHRFLFNLRMVLSDGEGLALNADEAWRPLLLGLLARSSDVVLVDLSDGPSWAWGSLQRQGLTGRAVFVADWSKLEAAEAALHEWDVGARCFAYAPDGEIQRRGLFRAAMLDAMRAAQGMPA